MKVKFSKHPVIDEKKKRREKFYEKNIINGVLLCHWCSVEVFRGISDIDPVRATIDHVEPLTLNRLKNDKDKNRVVCCRECNSLKGSKSWMEFLILKVWRNDSPRDA